MNAIIGDNGIITRAQEAKQKQGMAALEEFLQEKYLSHIEEFEGEELKVSVLVKLYPEYFYIPANHGIGSLKYIVDSDGKALYLINKSGLPEEIKEQLVGGDAGEGTYIDYFNLNDVYGVTSNLKVYYCSNGKDTISGVLANQLDDDNPQRLVFPSSNSMASLLSSYDSNEDGNISAEEVKSVKELVLDNNSSMTNLSDLFNLSSLQKLTIKTKELNSLDGIQNCPHLYYVYFIDSVIGDYSSLCGLESKLQYLYFYCINDDELVKVCNGISKAEFSKLEYFGIFGSDSALQEGFVHKKHDYNTKASKVITTLKPFDNLSSITKKSIKYLLINNNDISDLDLNYIKDFSNLYNIRFEYNSIKSLKGLENCNMLAYIFGFENNLGKDIDGDGENLENNALSSLKNHTSLYYLDLENNPDLRWVSSLSNCIELRFVYLAGCNPKMSANVISKIIIACGANYSLPCKFLTGNKYDLASYYTGSDVNYEELYSDLYLNSNIVYLKLSGASKLTNEELNTILKSMKNVKYLKINDCNLETLSFICPDGMNKLVELDVMGTYVTDFTNLTKNQSVLGTLRCGGTKDGDIPILSNIQSIISNLTGESYWGNTGGLNFGSAR